MYNYLDSIKDDVRNYINNIDITEWKGEREDFEEKLNDDLWVEDKITGNMTGSYTCNREKAKEYVVDNMDELAYAIDDFCIDAKTIGQKFIENNWEWMDVTIRCHLLGAAISEVLDELEEQEVL